MKPSTTVAMHELVRKVKATLPLSNGQRDLCKESENCSICALKLIEFLNMELDSWEQRLQAGVTPDFGDLNKLARTAKKVKNALKKGGFVDVL